MFERGGLGKRARPNDSARARIIREVSVAWLNLALLVAIVGGLLVLFAGDRPRAWLLARPLTRLCFQTAAVLGVAWFLVSLASNANAAATGFNSAALSDSATQLVQAISRPAVRSLLLIAVAIVFGTGLGLGAAIAVTAAPWRGLRAAGLIATVIWALPTFLVAILAQQAQSEIYNLTGTSTSGGYAVVTPLTVFWAAVVLGIRPAAYVYRQARASLELEATAEHVRAGRARGLREWQIALRYIVRPASGALVAGWLNSIRVVVGALPLVEFFFAYPGLGDTLLHAIGIHYPSEPAAVDPDLAIAAVLALFGLLALLESAAFFAQTLLDPRLRETRAA